MTRLPITTSALAVALLALTGCMGAGNNARVSSLPAAPTSPVTTQQLPPPPSSGTMQPSSGMDSGTMDDPNAPPPMGEQMGANTQVAAAPTGAAPQKEDVLGQWAISGSGETCQVFVSLTAWEGGHRASTRGCGSPELKNIGAWNVEGKYVVLKDNDGNAIGRLAQAGTGYQGRLELGGAVSMNR